MPAGIKPPTYLVLLESSQHSHLLINCQGVEFSVRRTIVCSQSTMLERAANGYLRKQKERRVKLTAERPHILSRILACV
ncbi:hypothetical protein PV04_02339 [Phialophora macrospora]|uniref:BTB domain-containing protein n=1 Tax=Phialophora macrospora TaxID=1851006 RepID=A0A0D2FP52_9EURO|nr:hypothetical protein PV04_02339 [Phialophora macrospora]